LNFLQVESNPPYKFMAMHKGWKNRVKKSLLLIKNSQHLCICIRDSHKKKLSAGGKWYNGRKRQEHAGQEDKEGRGFGGNKEKMACARYGNRDGNAVDGKAFKREGKEASSFAFEVPLRPTGQGWENKSQENRNGARSVAFRNGEDEGNTRHSRSLRGIAFLQGLLRSGVKKSGGAVRKNG
jgi:hypothetical protein